MGRALLELGGNNAIIVSPGAAARISVADVEARAGLIASAACFVTQLEQPIPAALRGLQIARAAGVVTVLNPAPAVDLTQVDLSDIDILTPNETEARVLLGLAPTDPTSNVDIAARILTLGCRAVVMTLGERGAGVFQLVDGQVVETLTGAWPVDVVDSNGAGDSFNAALCTALGEGRDLADAANFASATAGLCCTKWETVPSYHDRSQVEVFMKKGRNHDAH